MASSSQPSDELSISEVFAGENPIYAGTLNFPDHHQPAAYRSSAAFQPDASASSTLTFSNDVDAPMTAPVTDSTGWATKEAWTQHQANIKQLYFHEKKPLPEVMRLMKDKHGFRATVKMYKTHIQQWGLDKKIKEFEMRAIVRKYKQRENQGKNSIIRIRGQVRDFRDFIRYCHRKGISIDDIIARQTSSPTPEAVELLTPMPSPITTPQVLAIPERIFRCTRDYFKGSFESGIWVSTDPTNFCYSIKEGGGKPDSMIELYNLYDSIICGGNLIIAIASLKNVFSAEPPATLDILFNLMISFQGQIISGKGSVLLLLFSDVGKMLLGSEHPLIRICQWSASVDASDFEAIAIRCMEIMADQLQSSLGPMHKSTLFARRNLIRVLAHRGEAGIQKLQNLLGESEKTLRPDDVRVSLIREWLANDYINGGYYAEAKTLIEKNMAYNQDVSHSEYGNLRLLAKCQYALGEVDLGIATLFKAIESRMSMSTCGPQDSRVIGLLFDLEEWYREQDLRHNAVQVRGLRQDMSELMDTDGDSS